MEEFFSRATFATGRLIYIRRRTSLPLLDFYPDPLIPLSSSSSLFPRRGYRRSLPRISPSSLFFPWRKQKTILIYPIPGPIIIKRSTTDDKFLPTMDVRGGERREIRFSSHTPPGIGQQEAREEDRSSFPGLRVVRPNERVGTTSAWLFNEHSRVVPSR